MSLVGSTNEQKIWNYLLDKIKNTYGVAGLMGNLYAESGLRPNNLQNTYEKSLKMTDTNYTSAVDNGTYSSFVNDKAGYGLAQWTYWSRKQNLLNYARSVKKSIGDLEVQLEFLMKELSESYGSVLNTLKNATTVLEASNAVLLKYERPANQSSSVQSKRASYGQKYYDKYAKQSQSNNEGGVTMSNSSLVDYVKISPNRTSPRNHVIDTITIHCVVGQCSVETLGNIFAPSSRQASSNYGVGTDGKIGMYCEEKDRSWCSSSSSNDNRAITIEVASDTKHPYAVNDKAMAGLIKLLVDICKRNGIKELKWRADKSLIGQPDKQNMTVHRWFANKSCPGDYLYERHGWIADQVNAQLGLQTNYQALTNGVSGSASSTTPATSAPSTKPTTTPATTENKVPSKGPFRVQVLVKDLNIRSTGSMSGSVLGQTGRGVFTITETNSNGFGRLKSGAGWIYLKNPAYCKILDQVEVEEEATKLPYRVKISINDLRIRTSPSAKNSSNITGKYPKPGVYTIVDEATGPINSSGKTGKWGLLKSYSKNRNGWICLEVNGVTKL